MKKSVLCLLSAGAVLASLAVPSAHDASARFPSTRWQVFSRPIHRPAFINPGGIALDASGHVYVADPGHSQVQMLSRWGVSLAVFGSLGWRSGHFRNPIRVGVDRWGAIYVDDAGNNRIQKLSRTGKPLAVFGIQPFNYLADMAVSPWGAVYLAYYDHIVKIFPSGRREIWWRHAGPLAVDASGNVYTFSYPEYNRATRGYDTFIYKLSPAGDVLARWRFAHGYPQRIAVATDGSIYLFIPYPRHIARLSPSGQFMEKIPVPPGQYYGQGNSMAVDTAGNILLTDAGNQRINKLSPAGDLVATWGGQGWGMGRLKLPGGVAVDRRAYVYVADTWHHRVQKFAPNGESVQQWGTHGSSPRQFNLPTDVLVNGQGNIVVADFGNSRLQIFSPSGRLLRIVRLPGRHYVYYYGSYPGYYDLPKLGIAQDSHGNYLIADAALHRVAKISPSGEVLAAYSEWVTSRFSAPGGVAVDRADNIYVTDIGAARIVKLSPQGHRLAAWGRFGYVRPGDFNRPSAIALDAAGNIYVSDIGNQTVQELSPNGQPMHAWGILGAGPGQLAFPAGLTIAPSGTVYVADTWNNRIQRLTR